MGEDVVPGTRQTVSISVRPSELRGRQRNNEEFGSLLHKKG